MSSFAHGVGPNGAPTVRDITHTPMMPMLRRPSTYTQRFGRVRRSTPRITWYHAIAMKKAP